MSVEANEPPLPISGVVIARNEADRIERCVRSLVGLCAEVLVLDSGSTDDTVARARAAGARVEHQEWLGFSSQKNVAVSRAAQRWVLLLDADEWLVPSGAHRIRELFVANAAGQLPVEGADIWRLVRRTRFLGRTLRYGGWGSEAVERLFRANCRYLPARVHESLDRRGKRVRRLPARIEHDTARALDEYQAKLDGYADLFARQRHVEGVRGVWVDRYLHAAAYFIKNYLLRGGFLDGKAGATYHLLHTRYVYRKYSRLWQLRNRAVEGD
jgi:(heptosyl)LPS beta-1,4-glucosyltransferase